jgi:hypothetical protein
VAVVLRSFFIREKRGTAMYLVTYRVEQDKLPAFMNAADPHGTMRRCGPETEDFEVSHNELETIGQALDNIRQRLQTILLHLQERLDASTGEA